MILRQALLTAALGAVCFGQSTVTDLELPPAYGQTAWPSLHRDGRNSDFAPFVVPAQHKPVWAALDGAAVLPAPVAGPGGRLFVTTGRGPGTSHLHAFDRNGKLLWESEPQTDLDDLDSFACFSAPLIDNAGDLYLGDLNQLWAFHADGQVKWTVAIPGGGPFASLALLADGNIVGASVHGELTAFRRSDGAVVGSSFSLPGGAGPAAYPKPPGLWGGGLLDPTIAGDVFNLFLGREFEVTNTPAVHPVTGRIYLTAAGADPQSGALYGIDWDGAAFSLAFSAPIGAASGSSPMISFDGQRVYAGDGASVLRAIDAETGAELWQSGGAGASSPTEDGEGTVFSGGSTLRALNPLTGAALWTRNFDDIAAATLPTLPADPPYFLTGQPKSRTNSVITATSLYVHVAVALGYEYEEPATARALLQPRLNLLLTLDRTSGDIVGAVVLRDSNDGLISPEANGRLYSAHGALLSSTFYYGLNQDLPSGLRMEPAPRGGFSAFDPVSYLDVVQAGLEQVRTLDADALAALALGDAQEAFIQTRRAKTQAAATVGPLSLGAAVGEIPAASAEAAFTPLAEAAWRLGIARSSLNVANPTPLQRAIAAGQLSQADTRVAAAQTALE